LDSKLLKYFEQTSADKIRADVKSAKIFVSVSSFNVLFGEENGENILRARLGQNGKGIENWVVFLENLEINFLEFVAQILSMKEKNQM
jgi:hypothetical protein